MDYATFDKTMQLNVYAGYFLTQHFSKHWVQQATTGRVLFIGSINGKLAENVHTAYDTSKGAVETMVKTLAVSLAPLNIRVNGLAPGLFNTPLTAAALDDPQFLQWMQQHTPNGQVPAADVCGDGAVYLVSDAARHVCGHMLMVDGGMSIWQQPDP
jgi:NAD(P)-dependent dehydrogenase (short-subunit alcohol dehydrogenase family)